MTKDISYIPYHDWRKIQSEGNRTRDAHFIDAFRSIAQGKVLIINRPITYTELFIKKKTFSIKLPYELLLKNGNNFLYKIDENTFIIDTVLFSDIKQIIKKRKWFFDCYNNKELFDFYLESKRILHMEDAPIITANVFSYKFILKLENEKILFDAWDNFYLMPGMNTLKNELYEAYSKLSIKSNIWITNSYENIDFYMSNYNVKKLKLITNGVSVGIFKKGLPITPDLELIKKDKTIIGFGGKITHLFDVDLFNFLTKKNPKFNFVIIGQVLDKNIFSKIIKYDNVFYLGDKHYKEYPKYVSNFDIGIIPYKIGKNQHGGDSIKVYEYLASEIPVVGTNGNGLQFLYKYIDIAKDKEEFNKYINNPTVKSKFNIDEFSWESKSKKLLDILFK